MFSASFKIINQTMVKWSIWMNEVISSPFWHSTEIIVLGFLRHKPPKPKELERKTSKMTDFDSFER